MTKEKEREKLARQIYVLSIANSTGSPDNHLMFTLRMAYRAADYYLEHYHKHEPKEGVRHE